MPPERKLPPGVGIMLALAISLMLWAMIWLALRDHTHRPGTLDPILNHQGPTNP